MFDLELQVSYWKNSAADDLESAKVLIERNRLLHGLFFCHLVIEKGIKAHVVKETGDIAPKSHNLMFLSEKANLIFDEEVDDFLGTLMKYQLQGRYPDFNPIIPSKEFVLLYLAKTEKLLQWLIKKL